MQVKLGEKIKELRKRDERTQENLAESLGVTSQAVSRWESGGCYPDMEIVPVIANYFGVTIDELFGYQGEREKKIDDIIFKVDELRDHCWRNDDNLDECISMLREAMAEFPRSEKIIYKLALILTQTGWGRHKEWVFYDDNGYMKHNFDVHKKNEYWNEAIKLFENIIETVADSDMKTDSICNLVLLYRNIGEYEKALLFANKLPNIRNSREIMRTTATDGQEQGIYLGNALINLTCDITNMMVYALINNISHYDTDMPIQKIKGLLAFMDLIFDDGNFGSLHAKVSDLYLYLSKLQWKNKMHDEAFVSLDEALKHAKAFDKYRCQDNPCYTAILVKGVKEDRVSTEEPTKTLFLPTDWPMWCNPQYPEVEAEIKSDPRWQIWLDKINKS